MLGISEQGEAGVAAKLGGRAENSDGAELFEDVGIAEEGGFGGVGVVVGLVFADRGEDGLESCLTGKPKLSRSAGARSQT